MQAIFSAVLLVPAILSSDAAAESTPQEINLPKVLIIGDSISIGYTPHVQRLLKGKAVVTHHKGNAGPTGNGLKKIDAWLGNTQWDVIHFNWGLHDLCYRHPESKFAGKRDKLNGTLTTSVAQYKKNLDQLVTRLKETDAALIWASTTVVPQGEAGRKVGDDKTYNQVATKVMKQHRIVTNDLYALTKTFSAEQFTKSGDVHYKKSGSQKLARQVAAAIEAAIEPKLNGEHPDAHFKPDQSSLPAKVPAGAIVLFDGKEKQFFLGKEGGKIDWPIEEGCLVSSTREEHSNHIVSQWHFRDAEIHVEFNVSKKAQGNSGIYLHGNYELQILDTLKKSNLKLSYHDEGAIYGFHKPLVNAAKAAGEWQVYDILYRAPQRNSKGEITAEGSITAWLNGQKVQDHARFGEPRSTYHPYRYRTTDYLKRIWELQKKNQTGPFFLQDHGSPCRFRNIWIKPLDGEAFLYQPSLR